MYIVLQRGLIVGSHPFFRQNFPLDKFYIYIIQKCQQVANNDLQLRITLSKCVAISQKLQITFCILNPALYLYLYTPK